MRRKESHAAVLFLNSNRSEKNIKKIIAENRRICAFSGLDLKQEVIVSKGPDRDIDREAINMLILLLLSGKYEVVVVDCLFDLTDDISDLCEFIKDAASIGVKFFELRTLCFFFGG